ncbi:MAG TPA: hypothetical protein VIX17_28410 [Pyrinomonadaceae bacterium]
MSGSANLIERQRAKLLLRESEEHYRAVAEAATDASSTSIQTPPYSASTATQTECGGS